MFLPQSLEQFKCSGYADDTTIAVTSEESIAAVFRIYDQYGLASGAQLNRGKSKGMWIGSRKQRFGIQWVQELPLLGAVFSALTDSSVPTWELSHWSGRKLSFQGKSVVINMLALSKVWHFCHVFAPPTWAEKHTPTRQFGPFFGPASATLWQGRLFPSPSPKGALGSLTLG